MNKIDKIIPQKNLEIDEILKFKKIS